MLKNVIAPVQAWLLSQGRCVGCGKPLENMKKSEAKDGKSKVSCECGRIYIFNSKEKSYRRALLTEV